jgi:hypothetical protein
MVTEDVFFQIPFQQVPMHFISRRKVILHKGYAYVPEKDLLTQVGIWLLSFGRFGFAF